MKKLLGVVAAAAAGYVAGVLFAPKSGEATRKELNDKKLELQEKAVENKAKAKEVLDESTGIVKKGAAELTHEASDFGRKATTSSTRISKEASHLGKQAKRSLGRAADTATKTGRGVGESVNKLRDN